MNAASVCGLGSTASGPVTNALQHFRGELDTHISAGKCPAGVCEMTPPKSPAGGLVKKNLIKKK
jgi:hypothetical protein